MLQIVLPRRSPRTRSGRGFMSSSGPSSLTGQSCNRASNPTIATQTVHSAGADMLATHTAAPGFSQPLHVVNIS